MAYQIGPGQLHHLLDKASAIAICYNSAGTIVHINNYAAQKLEITINGKHQGTIYDFVPANTQIPLPGQHLKEFPHSRLSLQTMQDNEIIINPSFELLYAGDDPVMLLLGEAANTTREALKNEHAQFFAHYENFGAGAVFLGADNRIIDINTAFKNMFQYAIDEIRGMDIDEVVTHSRHLKEAQKISERVKSGNIPSQNARRFRRDGTAMYVEIRGLPLFKKGKLVAMIGIYNDITAQVKQKEKLRLFKKAFDVALDGIIITGPYSEDNPIHYANPQYLALTGYSRRETLGKNLRMLQQSDRNQHGIQVLRKAIKTGVAESVTLRNYTRNNKLFWNNIYIAPIKNKAGRITHFIGIQRDVTELIKSRKEFLRNENRLQSITRIAPVGIFIADTSGKTVFVNKRMEEIAGLAANELYDYGWSDALHPDDRPGVMQSWQEAVEQNKAFTMEYRYQHANGVVRSVYCETMAAYMGEDYNQDHIGIVFDVTESKQRLQKLKENEQWFRAIFSGSRDAIFVTDMQARLYDANESAVSLTGYNKAELMRMHMHDLTHNNTTGWFTSQDNHLGKAIPLTNEVYILAKNRQKIPVEFNKKIIQIGKARYILYIGRDVTERKKREAVLHEREARYSAMFHGSAAVMMLLAPNEGTIVEANKAALDFYGYSRQALLQKSYKELSAHNGLEIGKIIQDLHKEKSLRLETSHWLGSGKKREVELFAKMIPVQGENRIHLIVYDISDRIKAEADLAKALEKARESDRLKSVFLSTMSHELRTPLNHIIGFSDLLAKRASQTSLTMYARSIHKSGLQLLNIVEDIMDLSLYNEKTIKARQEKITLHPLFLNMADGLKQYVEKSGKAEDIAIRVNWPEQMNNGVIYSDPYKITQIMDNLFHNAIKFTSSGFIAFGLNQINENMIEFYVQDTGPGISEDKQQVIFDYFRRGEEHHSRLYGGIGIGLSLSKVLANILEGNIWVDSRINEGSTFYFRLPARVYEAT